MTQPNDFDPGSMVEWAKSMAEDSAERLSQTERLVAIRSMVKGMVDGGVIADFQEDEEGSSFQAAAEMLYMCQLIPLIFAKCYDEISEEIDAREKPELDPERQAMIDKLNRSFKL